jgi:hypothetical protein
VVDAGTVVDTVAGGEVVVGAVVVVTVVDCVDSGAASDSSDGAHETARKAMTASSDIERVTRSSERSTISHHFPVPLQG